MIGQGLLKPMFTITVKNPDGTTFVSYNTFAQGPNGITPLADRIPVNSDKFAQCANKAMQTGQIVDVMA